MMNAIIDIWKNASENTSQLGFIKTFKSHPPLEGVLFIILSCELTVAFVTALVAYFLAPVLLITPAIILISLITLGFFSAVLYKNRHSNVDTYRKSKLQFFKKLSCELEKYGLLKRDQLRECLSYALRELEQIRQRRNSNAAMFAAAISIVMSFFSIFVSRAISETSIETQAYAYIFIFGFLALELFLITQLIVRVIWLIAPREQMLENFSKDLSEFLALGLDTSTQQENVEKLIKCISKTKKASLHTR